jgi:hypothetical protein
MASVVTPEAAAAAAAKKAIREEITNALNTLCAGDEDKINDDVVSIDVVVRALELLRVGTNPISVNKCKLTEAQHALPFNKTIIHKIQGKHDGEHKKITNIRDKALIKANHWEGVSAPLPPKIKLTDAEIRDARKGKDDWYPLHRIPCAFGVKCKNIEDSHKIGFAHPVAPAAAAPAAAPAMAAPAMAMAAPAMAMAAPAMAMAASSDQKAIVEGKIRMLETLVKDTENTAQKVEYEKELTIERSILAALKRMMGGRRKSSKKTSKRKSKKSLKGGSKKRSKKSSKKSSKRKSKKSK